MHVHADGSQLRLHKGVVSGTTRTSGFNPSRGPGCGLLRLANWTFAGQPDADSGHESSGVTGLAWSKAALTHFSGLRYDRRAMTASDTILFSGGAPGAEAAFGEAAERHGVEEVNFTFDGHRIVRTRGVRVLNHEELAAGDVSLQYVARLLQRRYTDAPTIRKVLQTLWYQVNNGQEVYVVGTILDDLTVRGGTGWGAEFAKLCNKPLFVFDQTKDGWFRWSGTGWEAPSSPPRVTHTHVTGTGTRNLEANGRQAIDELFSRSF